MVWTGPRIKGASMVAAPAMIGGGKYKRPSIKIPMGGSPWMMEIRGWQAAARGFRYAMLPKITMEKIYASIKRIAKNIYNRSRETCPYDSGDLFHTAKFVDNSRITAIDPGGGKTQFIDIHIRYGGGSNRVDYAVYVHEGHSAPDGSWVMGNPWLVRAARRHQRELLRACKITAMGVWNKFARQVNTGSHWQALGLAPGVMGTPVGFLGGSYKAGAGAGWTRMLGGTGPTVM